MEILQNEFFVFRATKIRMIPLNVNSYKFNARNDNALPVSL